MVGEVSQITIESVLQEQDHQELLIHKIETKELLEQQGQELIPDLLE